MENRGNIKIANIKKGEPFDIYIGRANRWLEFDGSIFANPFFLKREADREAILDEYRTYARANPLIINSLPFLRNATLGCYCCSYSKETDRNGKKCHGFVLIELFDEFVK